MDSGPGRVQIWKQDCPQRTVLLRVCTSSPAPPRTRLSSSPTMRVENEESKSGTGRIFAEAYKHIKPVWHSKEFGRSTPSHGRSPSRDEPEQPAAGAQDALDGATTHAEGQGLIPPGLCAGPEPHVPGAFGDLREGRPGTEARETPRLPLVGAPPIYDDKSRR
jgi:hypothetical protein